MNGVHLFETVCVCGLHYPECKVYATFCCHLWPVWLCRVFSHYLINARFSEKRLLNKLRFSLQIWSKIFLVLRRIQRHVIINYIRLHVKYTLFLSDFLNKLNFLDRFSKKLKYQTSWNSVQLKAGCSMRWGRRVDRRKGGWADGQMDRHYETNTRFLNFATAPKDLFKVIYCKNR
jgi:hypothetical protein